MAGLRAARTGLRPAWQPAGRGPERGPAVRPQARRNCRALSAVTAESKVRDWRAALRRAVSPLDRGARHLNIQAWTRPDEDPVRPNRTAAVLVAVLDQPDPQLILTVRARHLAHHPGQVSFPGGSAMDTDASGVLTALREAEEEIGLATDAVEPIGFLDRVDTVSDFRVLPVVGLARPQAPFVLDPNEVESMFTVPLAVALDVDKYHEDMIERDGVRRRVYRLDWQGEDIWGITAHILYDLARRMAKVSGVPGST
ncbi:CoA pyrophosphatase [Marinihelvus fidelis]|uniref:CoA pyrophosphatase n=1 Tax=Marinihelvus fidelis TaxID=2613842 RepID=UPI001CD39C90|nr:CoA pyrophosphatase [Marinihelvus fidelis]